MSEKGPTFQGVPYLGKTKIFQLILKMIQMLDCIFCLNDLVI